ncbi:lamin tail domain-containing protein [Bacillus solitudinis]|uniref:lamin tail domain-containing protein n=1 Tax=Bacillus solitudinis TaxID=2014074 RepID=UPI001D0D6563|nr:lamin tail domain-containing protein [Bacillus solitudinis]
MSIQKVRKKARKLLLFVCTFSIIFSNLSLAFPAQTIFAEDVDSTQETESDTLADGIEQGSDEEDFNSLPPLLITEVSPNSKGGGTDYYEYFELYNNTNQPLSLTQYSFTYLYTDTGKELQFQLPVTTMAPQETLVFWFNVGDLDLTEFNQNFDLDLPREQVVEFKDVFPGFANGGNRALVINDYEGTEINYATYLGTDNDNTGAGIEYKYPKSGTKMDKLHGLAAPTPGTIDAVQVPTKPITMPGPSKDTEAPEIIHIPITNGEAFSPLIVEATIKDDKAVPVATLYYKEEGTEDFTAISMSVTSEEPHTYSAEVPGTDVHSNLVYYLEATDGINETKTEEYTIAVMTEDIDYDKVPKFLVTEIVPDSTNVGSADGYEFVEIYNNTNKDINFKDYKINYRYGSDPASDVVWASVPDDVVVPSKETLVFWIINSQNGEQTVADFNGNYGVNLVENEDIVRIYSAGMANAAMRGLIVATNAKKEIAVSYYQDAPNVDDTQPNKGIIYKYPIDGSTKLIKVSGGIEAATPGAVEPFQVPKQVVQTEDDTINPTIENMTNVTEVNQSENIKIAAKASDDIEVKTVRLFYRMDNQSNYIEAVLPKGASEYQHTIYSAEIIGKDYVDYYFVVSDGTNEVTSDTYRIGVNSNLDDSTLRLNVKNGHILAGEKVIKGTSQTDSPENVKLFIGESEVTENTYNSVEHTAYFAYEVSGINTFFQNGITMGDEILHIFDKGMSEWETITIPIEADRLELGDNVITVRAGNKASPFQLEESEENRDDYNLRNVRLVLSDGTILRDQSKSDPNQVFDMGDDGTYRPFEHFTFAVSEDHANSKTYKWDTTNVSDGEHIVKVQDADEELHSTVLVDNTAPIIETNVEEGKEYKGEFTITVEATDTSTVVKQVQVMLDDEEISIPYQTSSSQLSPGEHNLTVIATDTVGNKAEVTVSFAVVNENPNKPVLVSPTNGDSVKGHPNLKVNVTDPTDDDLLVTYYQGFNYNASRLENVKAFKNSTDVEPPQTMVPEGEESFSADDIARVSEIDGDYLTTDSTTQFPYHRFDVTIDDRVDEDDRIELVWSGKSLEGRKVSMYAWNHQMNKWSLVDYKIAGTLDFNLTAEVEVRDFLKDSKINVLIQDEIPSSPDEYDYTFAWMSDTQYYAESYPHIFERQTEWIADMKEEMKIKYVFHTGDLVDKYYQVYQWERADEYMQTLADNDIPYGVLAGNHDVDYVNDDYTEYYKWFGADRFENESYYGGSYKNNRGHYDLISEKGNDYIMMYMGWGITDEDIQWMSDVLKEYPDRLAILSFHEYLLVSGNRSPLGNKIYNQIVEPHANVVAVLSGHYHDAETLIDEIDDNGDGDADRQVYQMLADYQGGPEGGQGYLRLLHFDQDNNKINVNTYSPYLDDYNYYNSDEYPGKDEFSIELDLQVKEKQVATDYFAVNIYTNTEIGKVENVQSGSDTDLEWNGLSNNQLYSWYVVAQDDFTGRTVSDIWTFTKGMDSKPNPSPSNPSPQPNPTPDPGVQPGQVIVDNDAVLVERETTADGKTKVTTTVNKDRFTEMLKKQDGVERVTVNIEKKAGEVGEVKIPASIVKLLTEKNKQAVFEITSRDGIYRFPASEINSEALATELGADADNVMISIFVNVVEGSEVIAQSTSEKIVSEFVEFKILASAGDKEIELDHFNSHVEREILTKDVNSNRATVMKLEADGRYTSVPTLFSKKVATFKSMSNGIFVVVEREVSFTDLQATFWAKEHFDKLASKQIFQGSNGKVMPNQATTRINLAVLISRSLGLEARSEYNGKFTDVKGDEWFMSELEAVVEAGIITGKENGSFDPYAVVTREQAAAMISRAMKYVEFKESKLDKSKQAKAFEDYSRISVYAQSDVNQLLQAGIIDAHASFNPKQSTTRAQMAKMIDEFLQVVEMSN